MYCFETGDRVRLRNNSKTIGTFKKTDETDESGIVIWDNGKEDKFNIWGERSESEDYNWYNGVSPYSSILPLLPFKVGDTVVFKGITIIRLATVIKISYIDDEVILFSKRWERIHIKLRGQVYTTISI